MKFRGYVLQNRQIVVRSPAKVKRLFLQNVHTGSEAHPGNSTSLPGGKATGAWSWYPPPPTAEAKYEWSSRPTLAHDFIACKRTDLPSPVYYL